MATRSASTGVLVTLVTFVITTVALLVLCVVLFSSYQATAKELLGTRALMKSLALDSELSSEEVKVLITASTTSDQKRLVPYLVELNRQATGQLTGDRTKPADAETLKKATENLGVKEGETAKMLIANLKFELNSATTKFAGITSKIKDLEQLLEDARKATSDTQGKPSENMAKAKATLDSLKQVADQYHAETEQIQKTLEEAKGEFLQRMSSSKSAQEAEVGSLKSTNARLETRLNEAGKKLSQFEVRPDDPSSIVDGHVIEATGNGETIFLDIGKRDRLQPGTTFEVFENAEKIRGSSDQGIRGKASIQVMKVGEDTSTARVTRVTPGRPVIRGDVIANAVYSPKHIYKFLVHGKFDVDHDSHSTEDEANVIRNRIREWGGVVASEDRITGDLDFVVLGVAPRRPIQPSPQANPAELDAYQKAQNACDLYERLQQEAKDAKIPIMNLNRFQAITGMND